MDNMEHIKSRLLKEVEGVSDTLYHVKLDIEDLSDCFKTSMDEFGGKELKNDVDAEGLNTLKTVVPECFNKNLERLDSLIKVVKRMNIGILSLNLDMDIERIEHEAGNDIRYD